MKPHHVRMHPLGINRVAADRAGHSAACVCNRLLFSGRGFCRPSALAFLPRVSSFPSLKPTRHRPAITHISCIVSVFRSTNLALLPGWLQSKELLRFAVNPDGSGAECANDRFSLRTAVGQP